MAQLNSPAQPTGAAPPCPNSGIHNPFGEVHDQFADIRTKLAIEESLLPN